MQTINVEATVDFIYSEVKIISAECGISPTRQIAQRRIVGGEEAGFGSFPWQV